MKTRTRDYALAERVSKLGDDVLIGINEAAAVSGLSPLSLQQRRVRTFPRPLDGMRLLRWRLGDVRAWMRAANSPAVSPPLTAAKKRRAGRPRLPATIHKER